MLNVGIIGIGNAGNQVASLAHEKLSIPVIAINSSEKDLETLPAGIPKKLIRDASGLSKGAGKDRKLAKTYLKDTILSFISSEEMTDFMKELDFVFIVSSTGGGTGSGTAPIMTSILNSTYPDVHTILVGILPVDSEALSSHVNTLEYLTELYEKLPDQTYMLYDNDKLAGEPSYQIMETINSEIVNDINVLRCNFNYTTKYDSIDDRDMTRLISFPGRISVARLDNFRDKECDTRSIEDMIIEKIKKNTHVETQRDRKVMATGIITNLSPTLNNEFNDNIPNVTEFAGEAVHAFKHIYITEDRNMGNNVFYIMSGLTKVNDKINKISDRIADIEERQRIMEEESALSHVNMKELSDKISDKEVRNKDSETDLKDIFSSFGV